MGRFKLFLENFFAYGTINVINKIIPIIMLPIITRLLPNTEDFGRFDLYNMIINFGSSFALLGLYDAMFREYFEKEDILYKKKVTSTTLRIVLISTITIFLILFIFRKIFSEIFFGNIDNEFTIVMAAVGVFFVTIQNIFSAPTRMNNKRTLYIISGLLSAAIYYFLAILLVVNGLEYKGLIYGNIISSIAIVCFFFFINKKSFDLKLFEKNIAKELLKIGIPLMPVFIVYWAFNSVDKIMIARILDVSQVGVYSIGARVASVSQFIYMAFSGGWSFFLFSTMKEKDHVEMNSVIFEYLAIFSYVSFLMVTPISKFMFNILFSNSYVDGYIVFPYLFLAPLLLMLVQIVSSQFLIIKKSIYSTLSLIIGVLSNIVLNYFLIKIFGIEGCALSTLFGYIVALIIVTIVAKKKKLLFLNKRFLLISILLLITIIIYFFKVYNVFLIIYFVCFLAIFVNYYQDFKRLFNRIRGMKK